MTSSISASFPPALSPAAEYFEGHAAITLNVVSGVPSAVRIVIVTSVRAFVAPVLMTISRHVQSAIVESIPRLSVMSGQWVMPGTFWIVGLPWASIDLCSTTSLSLPSPSQSLKLATWWPGSVNAK